MSVSKWRYTKECDGEYCPGDCDLCDKETKEIDNCYVIPVVRAKLCITNAKPSADVVEVVRCRNCKHSRQHLSSLEWTCERAYPYLRIEPDDFCSHGETYEMD